MSRRPGGGLVILTAAIGFAVSLYLTDRAAKKIERVSLPGFSLELPVGEVTETSQEPSGGSHKVDLKSSTIGWLTRRETSTPKLAVQWMSQGGSQEEWRENYLPIFTSAIGGKANLLREETLDDRRWLYVVGSESAPVGFGVLSCDDDFQVVVILARHRNADRQVEAVGNVLRSGECSETRERRGKLKVATRLPEKFGRTSETDIEGFKSLDGELLVVNFTNGDIQRDRKAYKVVARSLLSTSLGEDIPESKLRFLRDPDLGRPASLLRFEGPGDWTTYLGSQYCRDYQQSLMIIWYSPEAADALASERMGQLGCPGDESRRVRRFSELAAEACDAGDRVACDATDTIE